MCQGIKHYACQFLAGTIILLSIYLSLKIERPSEAKPSLRHEFPRTVRCENTTSRSKEYATPPTFPSTNLDLPCMRRDTCDKIYLFILCPPFSGSTALYSLLSTSVKAVTLLEAETWAGEGQWLYFQRDSRYQQHRWNDKDGFFNATRYSRIIRNAWGHLDKNATVFIEKSPPNIIRAHKLYNEFKELGRVRFILMLQTPCRSKYTGGEYLNFVEYAHIIVSQFKEITLYLRYEDLLLDLDEQVQRIRDAFPELVDIDPSKKPKGDFGRRSIPLSKYIQSIDTIHHAIKTGNEVYLVPKHEYIYNIDAISYAMMKNLSLL